MTARTKYHNAIYPPNEKPLMRRIFISSADKGKTATLTRSSGIYKSAPAAAGMTHASSEKAKRNAYMALMTGINSRFVTRLSADTYPKQSSKSGKVDICAARHTPADEASFRGLLIF